jgi:hypothetical protein
MIRSERARALNAVKAGDVIYGIASGRQQKILFVYRADQDHIFARHITSQTKVKFRRDGTSEKTWDGGSCTIVSTAALPAKDHQVAEGLDRKMRTAKELSDLRLSDAEIDLLVNVHEYFKAHLLPED